jgi:hypothetical protein
MEVFKRWEPAREFGGARARTSRRRALGFKVGEISRRPDVNTLLLEYESSLPTASGALHLRTERRREDNGGSGKAGAARQKGGGP